MPPRPVTRSSTKEASTSKRQRRERRQSPPPPPLPWELPTEEQNKNYRRLSKRMIVPSKFFDPYTVHNLGLRNEVNAFVENMGWNQFAGMSSPTYEFITYEILSTIRSEFNPHDRVDRPSIFFRCLGEDRSLSMQQFNNIFGFPHEGINWNEPDFNPTDAWHQLTGQSGYNPSISKASQLRNHALRYIHRVMALSIFGRGLSTGVVNKVELLILWGMANGIQVNTGVWFLKHLLHVAYMPTGKVCVGGLLTHLANAFGFEPVEGVHVPVDGSILVDIDTLINMRMCRHIGGGRFRLLDVAGHMIEPEEELEQEEEEEHEHVAEERQEEQRQATPDMRGFHTYRQEAPPEWLINQFERLDARITQNENLLQQVIELQRQTISRAERMEEKLDRLR